MKRLTCMLLSALLLLAMAGCGEKTQTQTLQDDPAQEITVQLPAATEDPAMVGARMTDFALRLFRAGQTDGENALISPLSVAYALAMTANGAGGETLDQMEAVLGIRGELLNDYLSDYLKQVAKNGDSTLHLANAIWFREGFAVERDFLQTNADYYDAELHQAPFDDHTIRAINDWVKEHTNDMIPTILDRLDSDAVMCLVNALSFEAKWERVYDEYQVREGEFFLTNGQKRTVDFLHSTERSYLENEKATGFLKPYEGGRYAFAALLPKEGTTVAELLETMTGEALHQMLTHPETGYDVIAAIPKFETESGMELADVLGTMGMPDAFDKDKANFSAISKEEELYIGSVIHKTFLSLAEEGTRAGAATAVIVYKNAAIHSTPTKTVTLDRPFVYMLVDMETGTPFFLGTMMNPAK